MESNFCIHDASPNYDCYNVGYFGSDRIVVKLLRNLLNKLKYFGQNFICLNQNKQLYQKQQIYHVFNYMYSISFTCISMSMQKYNVLLLVHNWLHTM